MKRRSFLFGTVALALTGCQTTTATQTTEPAPDVQPAEAPAVPRGKGLVQFYRPEAFSGSANTYRISLEGQVVADIRTGERHATVVSPGTLSLKGETLPNILNIGLAFALMEKPELTVTVPRDTAIYVRITTGFRGGPRMEVVPSAQALKELPGLRPAPPLQA